MGSAKSHGDPLAAKVLSAAQPGHENFRPSLVYLGISSLVINILSLSLPILSLQIYDRILIFHGIGTLNVLLTAVIVALAFEVALRVARSYMTTWAGAAYEHHMSCRAVEHLLMSEPLTIERRGISTSLQSMTAIGKLREFVGGQAMVCLIDLPFVCLFIGLIGFIAGKLALVPLTILAVFALMAWFGSYELKNALIDREKIDKRRTSFLIEALRGVHCIKSTGGEAGFLRRYERLQSEASIHGHRIAFTSGGAAIVGAAFGLIMMVAVTATGAVMVIDYGLSVGTLVASVLLSGRIMQPIQGALGIWIRYQDVQLARNRVHELFAPPIMINRQFEPPAARKGSLELRNLTFSYQDDGSKQILQDINLSLHLGHWISVSGGQASGKSTLLKLMAGLLKPTSGSVLIDGIDAHSYPTTTLVKHVGYLATKGTTFNGTVRDNLSGFSPERENAALEMARFLGIEQAIASMPLGYDTELTGSNSDTIPSGLRQCIALARVLAHKPRLLLFDSADRALDQDNYNHLFRLLGRLKGKVAMVIVSDDRNFLRLAKEEHLLLDGQLVMRDVTLDSKVHDVQEFQELPI